MPEQITSWSYSRWSVYEECPAKAKYKFIDKLPEPTAPAMMRGNAIHKLAEQYTKGEIKAIPAELYLFKDQFAELKKSKPMVEETWAFTSKWAKTTWNDWQGCAVRVKIDAACLDGDTLYVVDHKTGKMRDGYDTQLSLYALAGMLIFPKIKNVITQLWYLDQGEAVSKDYAAKQAASLMLEWDKRARPMLADTRFAPKPGNACRWCPYSKSKGGPCKF